jgi:hypothetical protein
VPKSVKPIPFRHADIKLLEKRTESAFPLHVGVPRRAIASSEKQALLVWAPRLEETPKLLDALLGKVDDADAQWDSTNQVLFFANCGAGSVVRAYVDGRQRGADIDISKDFPGIQECYVDSLTAGPDGTTVIAALLNFGKNCDVREMILTYDSSGKLLTTWDPAPQYVEAIAYSKDDDAVFILGGRDLPDGPYARNYPLLVEYSRDGRVLLKVMVPAGALKDGGDSFHQGGEVGQPALRVTKNQVYFYAPTNREVVITDRNGAVLAYRSISDIIEKTGMEDGSPRSDSRARFQR